MAPGEFMSDEDFELNSAIIDNDIRRLKKRLRATNSFLNWVRGNCIIVIPADGLGTGLAELPTRAPKTYAYLCEKLEQLKDF